MYAEPLIERVLRWSRMARSGLQDTMCCIALRNCNRAMTVPVGSAPSTAGAAQPAGVANVCAARCALAVLAGTAPSLACLSTCCYVRCLSRRSGSACLRTRARAATVHATEAHRVLCSAGLRLPARLSAGPLHDPCATAGAAQFGCSGPGFRHANHLRELGRNLGPVGHAHTDADPASDTTAPAKIEAEPGA